MLLKSFKHNVGDINVTDHLVYHLWHLNQGERDTQCLIWTIILLINHFVSRSNTLYIYSTLLRLPTIHTHSDYLLYTYCLDSSQKLKKRRKWLHASQPPSQKCPLRRRPLILGLSWLRERPQGTTYIHIII